MTSTNSISSKKNNYNNSRNSPFFSSYLSLSFLFQGLFPVTTVKTPKEISALIIVFLRLDYYLPHVRMYRHDFMIQYKLKLHI